MKDNTFPRGEAVAHCLEGLPNFHHLGDERRASACRWPAICFGLKFSTRGLAMIPIRRMLQKALRETGRPCGTGDDLLLEPGQANARGRLSLWHGGPVEVNDLPSGLALGDQKRGGLDR